MPYKVKITSTGEKIAVCNGTIITIGERGDAYSLTIKLDTGATVSGFRGKSLGKPELGPNSFYIKHEDFLEHGNSSWNIGFPEVSDENPFG